LARGSRGRARGGKRRKKADEGACLAAGLGMRKGEENRASPEAMQRNEPGAGRRRCRRRCRWRNWSGWRGGGRKVPRRRALASPTTRNRRQGVASVQQGESDPGRRSATGNKAGRRLSQARLIPAGDPAVELAAGEEGAADVDSPQPAARSARRQAHRQEGQEPKDVARRVRRWRKGHWGASSGAADGGY
jgi:hypothetical protein